jgi:hypothetical protein
MHAYGGSNYDEASSVIEHSIDQGFVLVGHTQSYSTGSDIMLVKTDSVGVVMWTKTYGGSGSDYAYSVIEHSIDQGLLLAGKTTSLGDSSGDMMLVKTDSVGVELWTKIYDGVPGSPSSDTSRSVIEHSIDQGLLLAGSTKSFGAGNEDMMLVKTNSVGVELWTKTYGGTSIDSAFSLVEHSIDTGFLLAGRTLTYGAGIFDMMLVKTNSVGVLQWTKTYGGSSFDEAYSVIEHSIDQGLVLFGETQSFGAFGNDMMLVKTNSVGIELWTKTYGNITSGGSSADGASCVIEHSIDQGLLLAGRLYNYDDGHSDMMLVKTNSVGVEVWTKTYGGSGSDEAYSVIELSLDQGFLLVGRSTSYGAGWYDSMLVVQPSDGSGTAGADATPTEGTQSLTEADLTITEGTQTLTEGDVTLAYADQTVTTTVVFAITPSQSQSPSQSSSLSVSSTQTATQTASQSNTSSRSSTSSQTATQTASQTSTASHSYASSPTGSQTAFQVMATPSASASANVGDLCDDNKCAPNSTCVVRDSANQYICDCTAISTAAVRVVGQYCNTTLEGKPISVGAGYCPGCESLFVCVDDYDGSDIESYMNDVITELAAAFCDCKAPSQALIDVFGPVQALDEDKSLCMEFTVYSGNPNATAPDIVKDIKNNPPPSFTVHTNRLRDFDPCEDQLNGCISSSDSDSVLGIIIGVVCVIVVLGAGIAWYCIHKRVDRQFELQDEVTTIVNEGVVHKIQADMADARDIKTINNSLEPAPANQERLSHFQPSSNNINVPTAAASTRPRHYAFTKSKDTPAKDDDFEY